MPESLWKPHKSKDLEFLHRSYTPTFFSTLKKKYNFFDSKKILTFFWKNFGPKKFGHFSTSKSWTFWCWKMSDFFCPKHFQKKFNFFWNRKNCNFFRSWKKKLGYSFDAEIRDLSIYGVFRKIPVLPPMFWDPFLWKNFKFWSQNHGFWWNLLFWAL